MSSQQKQTLTTANPFEVRFGYHRAVRRGPFIFASGTTALKLQDSVTGGAGSNRASTAETADGGTTQQEQSVVHCPNDAYGQGLLTMRRCVDAVEALGGSLGDIMRIRMFVARPEDCSAVGQAFKETFGTKGDQLEGVEGRRVRLRTTDETAEQAEKTDVGFVRSLSTEVPAVAATMIVVPGGFVDGGILLEVEADAVVG